MQDSDIPPGYRQLGYGEPIEGQCIYFCPTENDQFHEQNKVIPGRKWYYLKGHAVGEPNVGYLLPFLVSAPVGQTPLHEDFGG